MYIDETNLFYVTDGDLSPDLYIFRKMYRDEQDVLVATVTYQNSQAYTVSSNMQDYVCTYELYQDYIRMVDAANDYLNLKYSAEKGKLK